MTLRQRRNILAIWNSSWPGLYTQRSSDAARGNLGFLSWHLSLHSAPSNLFAGQDHYLHQAASTPLSEHWNTFLFPLGTTKYRFYSFTLWVGKGPRIGGPSRLIWFSVHVQNCAPMWTFRQNPSSAILSLHIIRCVYDGSQMHYGKGHVY